MSPTSASSMCAARCLALSTSASVARSTADPPSCSDRDPPVPPPLRTSVGVDCDEPDPVDGDPGLVADDHRERRLVTLAVRRRAGHHRGRAVVVHLHRAVLAGAAAGGDLDVRRHADAEQRAVAIRPSRRLLAAKLVVAGPLGDGLQRGAVGAAVVGDAGEGGEREDVVGEQVPAAQLDRVDAQLDRRLIDDPLEQRRRLGSARRRGTRPSEWCWLRRRRRRTGSR